MDLLKLILDGGWCIDHNSLQDAITISGVDTQLQDLALHFEKQKAQDKLWAQAKERIKLQFIKKV